MSLYVVWPILYHLDWIVSSVSVLRQRSCVCVAQTEQETESKGRPQCRIMELGFYSLLPYGHLYFVIVNSVALALTVLTLVYVQITLLWRYFTLEITLDSRWQFSSSFQLKSFQQWSAANLRVTCNRSGVSVFTKLYISFLSNEIKLSPK